MSAPVTPDQNGGSADTSSPFSEPASRSFYGKLVIVCHSPVLVTLGPRGPLLARRHLPCLRFGADVGIGTERGVGVTQAPRGTVK